jgi:multicomponent Na+:H+ antiporter subunit B
MRGPFESIVLQFIVRVFMVPFILLFALYVLVHGESSPGGGFQAGAIMAGGLLLGRISLDLQQTERWFSTSTLRVLSVAGLLIFFLVGLVPIFNAGDFLDYAALPIPNDDGQVFPHFSIRSVGIFIVEVGIALGVMATLTLIFDYLSENTRDAG